MNDVGLTHIALPVTDLDESADFYERYARMQIVHRRDGVLWLSDKTRPFVLVLIESAAVLAPAAPDRPPRRGLREPRRGRSPRRARAHRALPDLGARGCGPAGRLLGVPARSRRPHARGVVRPAGRAHRRLVGRVETSFRGHPRQSQALIRTRSFGSSIALAIGPRRAGADRLPRSRPLIRTRSFGSSITLPTSASTIASQLADSPSIFERHARWSRGCRLRRGSSSSQTRFAARRVRRAGPCALRGRLRRGRRAGACVLASPNAKSRRVESRSAISASRSRGAAMAGRGLRQV